MPIPDGHEHEFRPIAKSATPDGGESFTLACQTPVRVEQAPGYIVTMRGCGLEERRVFAPDGRPLRVLYRYSGVWFSAVDLLRLLPVPLSLCERCRGDAKLEPCPGCGGTGVVEASRPVARPDLTGA